MPRFPHLELHRRGIGLLSNDGTMALHVELPGEERPLRRCSCGAIGRRRCEHLVALEASVVELGRELGAEGSWEAGFAVAPWAWLAQEMHAARPVERADVRLQIGVGGDVWAFDKAGVELARFSDVEESCRRLVERLAGSQVEDDEEARGRAAVLERLAFYQRTAEEREVNRRGVRTRRQAWEDGFWYRLAYHCVREAGLTEGCFRPVVDRASGELVLAYQAPRDLDGEATRCKIKVPRRRAQAVLRGLAEIFPEQQDLDPTGLDLEPDTQEPEVGQMSLLLGSEIESSQSQSPASGPPSLTPPSAPTAPSSSSGTGSLARPPISLSPAQPRTVATPDSIELTVEALERHRYWVGVRYRYGAHDVALSELLCALREDRAMLEIGGVRVDLVALDAPALSKASVDENLELFHLSAAELLRLQATSPRRPRVEGRSHRATAARRLLAGRPSERWEPPQALGLGPSERSAVDGLRYLCEHRLGGVLCEAPARQRQVLAVLFWLRGRPEGCGPCLVVAPEGELGGWREVCAEVAPKLRLAEPPEAFHGADFFLVPHAALRHYLSELRGLGIGLALLDEAHDLPDGESPLPRAFAMLGAEVKIGVASGALAPDRIKPLLDLVAPGYLGDDASFMARYGGGARPKELERLVASLVWRGLA